MASNRDSQMPPLPTPAADETAAADASAAPAPKKDVDVEVIALSDGFYRQMRIPRGKQFTVKKSKLGTWMKCVDPVLQKEHERNIAKKKADIKKAVI